jgi:hypothetical protein
VNDFHGKASLVEFCVGGSFRGKVTRFDNWRRVVGDMIGAPIAFNMRYRDVSLIGDDPAFEPPRMLQFIESKVTDPSFAIEITPQIRRGVGPQSLNYPGGAGIWLKEECMQASKLVDLPNSLAAQSTLTPSPIPSMATPRPAIRLTLNRRSAEIFMARSPVCRSRGAPRPPERSPAPMMPGARRLPQQAMHLPLYEGHRCDLSGRGPTLRTLSQDLSDPAPGMQNPELPCRLPPQVPRAPPGDCPRLPPHGSANSVVPLSLAAGIPGDIIVADDDGVVVVPATMASAVIKESQKHHDWEEFSRVKLMEGGPLQRYYPLHDDAQGEYEEWRKKTLWRNKVSLADPQRHHLTRVGETGADCSELASCYAAMNSSPLNGLSANSGVSQPASRKWRQWRVRRLRAAMR